MGPRGQGKDGPLRGQDRPVETVKKKMTTDVQGVIKKATKDRKGEVTTTQPEEPRRTHSALWNPLGRIAQHLIEKRSKSVGSSGHEALHLRVGKGSRIRLGELT